MAAEVMGGFLQVHPRVTQRSKRLANFGMRFRRGMINRSTDDHPLHLHRHTFEVTSLDGKQLSGLNKDVVIVPADTTAEVDFTASNPGLTLFHYHNQTHMDFGFMTLFKYV
jgi:FtsP/CotA-like multicopper oxidase with cupredoxin domain